MGFIFLKGATYILESKQIVDNFILHHGCDRINDSFVEHHGIEGQKWGVRRGPPYPLDRKSNDKGMAEDLDKYSKNAKRMAIGSAALLTASVAANIGTVVSGFIVPYLIGASATSGVMLIKSLIDWADVSSNKNKLIEADATKEKLSQLKKKSKNEKDTINDDMAKANEKKRGVGYVNNCTHVVAAFEMRRRGYDVVAKPRLEGQPSREAYSKYFKNFDTSKPTNSLKNLKEQLSSQPNGARGFIGLTRKLFL